MFDSILKHLTHDPSDPNKFYLIEPHLLYTSDEQAKDYLAMMQSTQYSSGFHTPTVQIIKSHLDDLFEKYTNGLSFVDLGPGYPDKALPVAEYFQSKNQDFDYYPVDVSPEFLRVSEKAMQGKATKVLPIQSLFETCQDQLPKSIYEQKPLVICLGLTFMNFDSQVILNLLKNLAGQNGKVLIASELITESKTVDDILSQYDHDETRDFSFGLLKQMGVQADDVVYKPQFKNHRVEMTFQFIKTPVPALQNKGLKVGSEIVVAVSYRYRLEDLKVLMNKNFKTHQIQLSDDKSTAVVLGSIK